MSDRKTSKIDIHTAVKYACILVFFALLSGLFSPIITHQYPDKVFTGMLVLFSGLMGALLIYKATQKEGKESLKYIILGGIIMAGSMAFIMAATGRFG